MSRVSVVLPLFNGLAYIEESIESVKKQTIDDWELLIINDFGSDDGCAKVVAEYAKTDARIKLIQPSERLGLAASLNLGLTFATGEYIARVDVDDPSEPTRFEKQVAFLDSHPELSLCGVLQRSITPSRTYTLQVACDPDELKTAMFFGCEISHCGVMLRKSDFDIHNWRYDPNYLGEDYELWTRILMEGGKMANIPEVLVNHRWGFDSVSMQKGAALGDEVRTLSKRFISSLGVDTSKYDDHLFSGWRNRPEEYARSNAEEFKAQGLDLLQELYACNLKCHFCDSAAMLTILDQRWTWILECCGEKHTGAPLSIRQLLLHPKAFVKKYREFIITNPSRKVRMQKIASRTFGPAIKKIHSKERKLVSKESPDDLQTSRITDIKYTPYTGGRIRMIFLFQMGSFWPSWDSFYNSCIGDDRLDCVFTLLDEQFGDTDQMHTNKVFLEKSGIPYVRYTDDLLEEFRPHVLILQTPYDEYHRAPHVRSGKLKQFGCRLVYITYGIEIADTDEAHKDHFLRDAVLNSWRIYTFSERMRHDYLAYSPNGDAVRALGHPKFDGYTTPERFSLSEPLKEKIAGRKVVFWHVHFPKFIPQKDGSWKQATPYLDEYVLFADRIQEMQDLFFVFLPHPKFLYENTLKRYTDSIINALSAAENAYIDLSDDYRSAIIHADAVISDRSALMVEAAAMDVPVLYMSNPDYDEPMTAAIQPLMDSYEQGHIALDMLAFVERFRVGLDTNKQQRETAFAACIPFFDGKCGERIKEDILDSVYQETVL